MAEAIKVIVSLVVVVPIVSKLFAILNYNDFDIALSPKPDQKINAMLNFVRLFICNIVIILCGLWLSYGRVRLTEVWANFINWFEVILFAIISFIYVFIKPKEGNKLYFLQKREVKFIIGAIVLILNCIFATLYTLVYALPTNLVLTNILLGSIIILFFSTCTMQLLGIISRRSDEAKFFIKLDGDEKYYIYYTQKDGYAVCGTEKKFSDSLKYKCIKVTELKDKFEIIRDNENV